MRISKEITTEPPNKIRTLLEEIVSLPLRDGLPRHSDWCAIQINARSLLEKMNRDKE